MLLNKVFNDDAFLLTLGGLYIQEGIYFVDVVIHGFLIVKRMEVQVEHVFIDQFFRASEFRFDELYEDFGMGHELVIIYTWVD